LAPILVDKKFSVCEGLILEKEEELRCPRCGSTNIIENPDAGELVCADCGLIISSGVPTERKEWRAFDSDEYIKRAHTGAPISPTRPSFGLDTGFIGQDSVSKKSAKRFQRTKKHVSDSKEKTIEPALMKIKDVAETLNIPEEAVEDAAMLYRMAAGKGLVKGRSMDAMVAAVIYAACRRMEIPRTLESIAEFFGLKEKDIGRSFRFLFRKLGIKIPPPKPEKFAYHICTKLGLSEEVATQATRILKLARKMGATMGREPVGVAAAAVYMACQEQGIHRTQRELAQAAGVTEVTVRNRYKELLERIRPTLKQQSTESE
jgi:transcription initiation factor TFIIB